MTKLGNFTIYCWIHAQLTYILLFRVGPVSAAIHVNDDEHKDQVLADLQKTIDSNPLIKQYLDVHLILDNYDRQFNMWRNVAKLYARTGYVMMLGTLVFLNIMPCIYVYCLADFVIPQTSTSMYAPTLELRYIEMLKPWSSWKVEKQH